MTEVDVPQTRPPEPLSIHIVKASNLKLTKIDNGQRPSSGTSKGTKGDNVQITVKVEFGEKVLGESPKVDCVPDTPAEIDYTATLNCSFEDPLVLDEISYKPVVLTVTEVLPKEKKQKEEKTAQLGQCTVDLLPLVKGATKHHYNLVINPLPGSPLETIPPEGPKPEMEVVISVQESLLEGTQIDQGNLMTLTIESLYSPPESWTMTGSQYAYAAALPIPMSADKETPVVFANGALKPSIDKEPPNRQKKWAVPGSAQGNSIYIPESFLPPDNIDDEDGEFKSKDDREHRHTAETEKLRVTWNTERRCYLDSLATKSFQDKIAKCRYWPVEVMRLPQPAAAKGKKPGLGGGKFKDDEGSISYHGVAFVNLAPLLYPGVKRIRGAYKVHAYTDHAMHEKTKRKTGFGEEAGKIAFNILNRNSASPFPKKAGKEGGEKKEKEVKKGHSEKAQRSMSIAQHQQANPTPGGPGGQAPTERDGSVKSDILSIHSIIQASQTIKSDTGSEMEGQPPVNVEGQQYVDAKAYVMLEISLTRPLIPKRPPEELARRVAEYIPPRPLFPKRTDGAQRAVEDFHNQVGSVANLILDEFRDQFGDLLKVDDEPQTVEAMESRRQKLIYELNSSGKYFAFKEQLKYAVVKIVREKYLKTSAFEDRQELQTFLSELYVYLIDQMHVALGKFLALEDQAPIPKPLTDSAQLKHFAREAEVNGNYELATKYYQERIARNRNDPSHWFDYGTFCLYINDITKAEECFKECIAIDQKHLQGLLLYGVVCTLSERNEAAETFFEAATCVDPKSILAWTMLGLFYDAVNNEIGAEMAYLEANKLNQAAAVAEAKALREDDVTKERLARGEHESEDKEVDHDQGGLAPPSVPDIKQPSPPSSDKPPTSARSGKGSVSDTRRMSASKRSGSKIKTESSTSRPGSHYKMGSQRGTPQPAEETEEPPIREPTPVPRCSIYMQTIEWLIEVKAVPFTERALAHELLSPMGGPTSGYHINYARLKLQKKEYKEAENSLDEALQFDYQNPDAWALMGHVKYMTNDVEASRDCYERTISFTSDAAEMHSIYLRLASIYLQEEKFSNAKNTFLMACKRSPSCVSWLGVGIACYRLGELAESEDALSEANILNNTDPEVWGYLSLVCLKTGRQLEAEQAYKYALKLNLSDYDLLTEIQHVQQDVGFGNPEF
ncbi:cilia- and flagella-associated protein 70-like isoform X9 [Crassostrea angulata]|uniref:cilia- and flagella-associated protein 70-like isoform X9 n=1 Tax=Magallana angulata TaxID=2784310 RepID=UPI0022B091DD|nr:cilia- and flagella-associated protein 70-like isoform X9 [Crassostrea angulata]